MEPKELFRFLMSEAEHHFEGWYFSYLGDRLIDFPLTWSYRNKILHTIRISNSLLDMGSGENYTCLHKLKNVYYRLHIRWSS